MFSGVSPSKKQGKVQKVPPDSEQHGRGDGYWDNKLSSFAGGNIFYGFFERMNQNKLRNSNECIHKTQMKKLKTVEEF